MPFVERELKSKLGDYWVEELTSRSRGIRAKATASTGTPRPSSRPWWTTGRGCFKYVLGFVERSYVGELLEVRNIWAHEKPFTSDDVYRALDTMQRLLQAISAGEQAEAVGR